MYKKQSGIVHLVALLVVGILGVGALVVSSNIGTFRGDTRSDASTLAEQIVTATLTVGGASDVANEDASSFVSGGNSIWIGNGASTNSSYLGVKLTGDTIPKDVQIQSAELIFTPYSDQWIALGVAIYAEKDTNPSSFSTSSKPSSRALTSTSATYADNVKWTKDSANGYNVKSVVQELSNASSFNSAAFIIKGSGSAYGRKFVYSTASGKQPKLVITYKTSTAATASPIVTATAQPTSTATATARATATTTATARPTNSPAVTASPLGTPNTPSGTSSSQTIFGAVSAELLGTCSQAIHDSYVATGPDGKLYRTWHPQKHASGCTFAHEHGDNPSTSNIFRGAVPFGYVGAQMVPVMDEPHAGFKCFVHNKNTRNDEGGVMLHDSYYCFHMGTGGAARFTARFHSLDMHVVTSKGARMDVMGMADIGNVGTICDEPRQQRTVMGFGCKLDSSYEIWENVLRIRNQGNTIASAVTSTAAFDSITVMDPADKTKAINVWDPQAQSQVFKFANDRSGYRGCDREAYSGPLSWTNRSGSEVYYTDVYGNVVNGGPIKQFISKSNMSDTGTLSQFGGLIMAYKGGNDPQVQFKYRKSSCGAGLGVKN